MNSKNEHLAFLEKNREPPKHMRTYHSILLEEFESKVRAYDEELSKSLYAGDVFIIRGVIKPSDLEVMKKDAIAWGKQREPKYEKMVVGAKDYHQIITEDSEANKMIKIGPVRHSYFFFRWNDDPIGAFRHGNHIWGLIKLLGGFDYDSFTSNFSNDAPIDRSQLAHYPSGGLIPRHTDPYHNQKSILGVYLSKYGEDFESGGIYFVDKDDKDIPLEPEIERGDAVIAYPTVVHGVARIDPHKKQDWETDKGRWFLGLYTNDSNEKKDRITSAKI